MEVDVQSLHGHRPLARHGSVGTVGHSLRVCSRPPPWEVRAATKPPHPPPFLCGLATHRGPSGRVGEAERYGWLAGQGPPREGSIWPEAERGTESSLGAARPV